MVGLTVRGDYIDFISSYCDSWCERCPFTARCSSYAVRVAAEMCEGDVEAAIALAVGAPPPVNEAERQRREEFLEELNYEPTESELAQVTREEAERDERLDESALATNSELASMLVHQWLEDHREQSAASGDALHGEGFDEHPIQNDWNGSANIHSPGVR